MLQADAGSAARSGPANARSKSLKFIAARGGMISHDSIFIGDAFVARPEAGPAEFDRAAATRPQAFDEAPSRAGGPPSEPNGSPARLRPSRNAPRSWRG